LKRQLAAFIEWEVEENDRGANRTGTNAYKWVKTGVDEHELSFADVELEIDDVRVRFRGFIDRVEKGIDPRGGSEHLVAAVDYKSTVYSTPAGGATAGWRDGVVLQVPLYAYALTRIRPGTEVARVEYRSIRGPRRAHTLALYRYDKRGLVRDEEMQDRYEQALRDVTRHIGNVRAGVFPPQPPPSCKCPKFCHAWDICRIPGGPVSSF
jgi:hypothetical protein